MCKMWDKKALCCVHTIRGAAEVERTGHCKLHGVSHPQAGGHFVISRAIDSKCNLPT